MNTNNFRRSNVNAKTLQITDPGRSSFNLGHKNELSIPFGKIVPVSHRILLPSDTFQGSIKPNFHLEKIATPSIGPTRLDTHTFLVNFRRINNQMRQNLEKGTNFFPSFNMFDYLTKIAFSPFLYAQADYSSQTFIGYVAEMGNDPDVLTVRDFITSFWSIVTFQINKTLNAVLTLNHDLYYQRDKLLELKAYYLQCSNNWNTYKKSLSSDDILDFYRFAVVPFFKPWDGASSLFDYLGYPVITEYNQVIGYYENLKRQYPDNWSNISNTIIRSLPSNYPLANKIFTLRQYLKFSNASTYEIVNVDLKNDVSELPIRAYYAVWYDYLRNWHIEERQNILDPDGFSNNKLIGISPNEPEFETNISAWVQTYFPVYSLVFTRSRDYNSDFLTSIQSDDVFRHVYSPVFSPVGVPSNYTALFNDDTIQNSSTLSGLVLPDSAGENYIFPSDGSHNNSSDASVFAQDLQTMRRAGMLEKWLARNYYFPDTYVGRLQARFGVRPSDYEVLVSNYLGGSETFITGTELVANMSTSETVVGSRNLKADMSTQDNYSGTVSDYSYLISVVSTVPIVSYDVLHPSVNTIDFVDFPQPEFATDTRVEARVCDFLRGFEIKPFIGYVPRYYMFRTSADETHGRYLTDYRTFNWFRDAYSMSQQNFEFSLNPYSLRVNLPLDAFIGLQPWDDFAYGDCDCQLVVNRALPAAIEII